MQLSDQVCNLELSMRLKELGIPQDSLFKWIKANHPTEECSGYFVEYSPTNENYNDTHVHEEWTLTSWAAYSVAELSELLPIMVQIYKSSKSHWECVYEPDGIGFVGKTEADTKAKMLIHLLENKLVELK